MLGPLQVWRDVGRMEEEDEEAGFFREMGLGCIDFLGLALFFLEGERGVSAGALPLALCFINCN